MKWTTEAQKWAEESRIGEAERAEAERLARVREKDEVGLREVQAAVGATEMVAAIADDAQTWIKWDKDVNKILRQVFDSVG